VRHVEHLCRQKALDDALLHSGQFKEALQAVLDWLYKMEPQLGDDQLVHGDTDTVGGLREEHAVSQSLPAAATDAAVDIILSSCAH